MTDFGTDFWCDGTDIDGNLSALGEDSQRLALYQALVRRLVDSTLFYDPDYGLGLHRFLGATVPTEVIARDIETELIKDERVFAVAFVGDLTDEVLDGTITVTTYVGEFSLTVTVDQAAITIDGREVT